MTQISQPIEPVFWLFLGYYHRIVEILLQIPYNILTLYMECQFMQDLHFK